uniref:Ig-like domain-containing protein n=1 Tax=Scleropages formosus TaxID=113540 RepID=A0A8C9S086_SCLFO
TCLVFVNVHSDFHCHVFQPHRSKSVRLGDPVTLECYTDMENVITWIWFKDTMEHGLKSMITVNYENQQFHAEFANDPRIAVQRSDQYCNLSLSQVSVTDVASYHCGIHRFGNWYFGAGTFLVLKGKSCIYPLQVIQQPVSDPVRPGDSVTLQCTVDSETCAGEHSVYWFRHGSGESLPGLIYTHGNRSDECEKSPEAGSPTHGCVYSLPKRNLSRSDAGIYYCAVATCGHILFGNGTKLDTEGNVLLCIFRTACPTRGHGAYPATQGIWLEGEGTHPGWDASPPQGTPKRDSNPRPTREQDPVQPTAPPHPLLY